ncbi:CDP-diacylglycerol diphosphatase [Candidatus Mycolicibacterium alkanivorans]|uniref:CDP-diacylglycerol diphosphatase n=1 Tax=Candidatus Mycolicibacterium alkanivorans TaxID=2954114 RepID=A0ABS9YZ84_9MYCO|nr:CDP-diacylglycerol diphosphatase [Candidatus Mycolicibacterium alkanivorans]MCI4675639.1 CDP-diacylglycerol diphosphatase [Candidatus Mycolicibacterium alkanivorans]
MRPTLSSVLLAAALAMCLLGSATAQADPNALWTIVHDQCVADEQQQHDPAPCSRVDLSRGEAGGYAVLKDLVGYRQYLLIPTARIDGMESAELLEPGATNYFAAAWRARSFVEQRAGGTIARDWMSLAVNSAVARTQNQLHIHVDCLRADIHDALHAAAATIGPAWTPLPVPLVGHTYWAMTVGGTDLNANPFTLLADGLASARADMGLHTLVVVGATDPAGRPGFIILADRADGETDAGGEELQDHDACPPPLPATPTTAK